MAQIFEQNQQRQQQQRQRQQEQQQLSHLGQQHHLNQQQMDHTAAAVIALANGHEFQSPGVIGHHDEDSQYHRMISPIFSLVFYIPKIFNSEDFPPIVLKYWLV